MSQWVRADMRSSRSNHKLALELYRKVLWCIVRLKNGMLVDLRISAYRITSVVIILPCTYSFGHQAVLQFHKHEHRLMFVKFLPANYGVDYVLPRQV